MAKKEVLCHVHVRPGLTWSITIKLPYYAVSIFQAICIHSSSLANLLFDQNTYLMSTECYMRKQKVLKMKQSKVDDRAQKRRKKPAAAAAGVNADSTVEDT